VSKKRSFPLLLGKPRSSLKISSANSRPQLGSVYSIAFGKAGYARRRMIWPLSFGRLDYSLLSLLHERLLDATSSTAPWQ
jgi:hypothetical protein